MGKWKRTELSPALCTIIAGSTPPTSDARYWDGNNVWVTPNDLSRLNGRVICDSERKLTELGVKRTTGKLLPANSVVISCRAPVGYCAVVSVPFTINQGCKSLICHSIDETYLYYYLSQSTEQLERVSSGTTFIELPKKELARFKVAYPDSCVEQAKIAEVLSTVDEAIDKTRTLIEKYKNIKAGMMQDLLGSIDSDEYRVKLSTCALLLNGDRGANYPTAADIVAEGCAFINAGHLENGKVDWQVCDYITHEKYMSLRGAKIQLGDIIYCLRGTLGKNAFVDKDIEGTVASSLVVIRPVNINNRFLFYQLNSFIEEKQRLASDNGTAQPNLSAKSVGDYKILVPSPEIQAQIAEQLTAADKKIQTERNYLEKLQNIKRGLIQDLLDPNGVSVDALM